MKTIDHKILHFQSSNIERILSKCHCFSETVRMQERLNSEGAVGVSSLSLCSTKDIQQNLNTKKKKLKQEDTMNNPGHCKYPGLFFSINKRDNRQQYFTSLLHFVLLQPTQPGFCCAMMQRMIWKRVQESKSDLFHLVWLN